jgi:hypothetical protein
MLALLACLPLPASGALDEWSALLPPALCRSAPESVQPAILASGSHLEAVHSDARFDTDAHQPALAFSSFLQIVEEDARLSGAHLELQRQGGGALVRGDAAAVERARALQAELDRAGQALDVELDVRIAPADSTATAPAATDSATTDSLAQRPAHGETALAFHRRVRSGDLAFFGRRDARAYVSGFDVEVAAHSGAAEPTLGRATTGRGLHVLACRVEGGERVFVWGMLDIADLLQIEEFDPKTSDLGILQQPHVAWAQAVFAGVVDASTPLEVTIQGARTQTRGWKLEIRAKTTPDAVVDAAAGKNAGFAVIDMALLSTELPQLVACEAGTLLRRGGRPRPIEVTTALLPPSAVATLVESARGPAGRSARAALYWSERVLLVPRSDATALSEARAFVRAAESARLAQGRIELDLDGAHASLPTCALAPARFATGTERPLLVEYRLEVAPEMWMPSPIVEPAFDGVCFEIAPESKSASAAVWMSTSGPVTDVGREGANVGRLQLAQRSLRSGALHAPSGSDTRLELSGGTDAVAVARFEAR